ncbi:hypothetical protein PIB30_092268 [Stylosanthes scabra]|uniref:Uncharacterized protein n=1 Tax=Stylosanthes scabra TaxID=79078 RepID=A0ABU6QW71_9FABA|nr:hypothetical protein [Stylosanthes scabra]
MEVVFKQDKDFQAKRAMEARSKLIWEDGFNGKIFSTNSDHKFITMKEGNKGNERRNKSHVDVPTWSLRGHGGPLQMLSVQMMSFGENAIGVNRYELEVKGKGTTTVRKKGARAEE